MAFQRKTWNAGKASGGHCGKIVLTHRDSIAFTHWALEFDYDGDLDLAQSSTGKVTVTHTGRRYRVVPDAGCEAFGAYQIAKGQRFEFTYQGSQDQNDSLVENVILTAKGRGLETLSILQAARPSDIMKLQVGDIYRYNSRP